MNVTRTKLRYLLSIKGVEFLYGKRISERKEREREREREKERGVLSG